MGTESGSDILDRLNCSYTIAIKTAYMDTTASSTFIFPTIYLKGIFFLRSMKIRFMSK